MACGLHYQILEWLLFENDPEVCVLDWGWNKSDDGLIPIMTDMDIAPPSLTEIIRCDLKISSKNPCGQSLVLVGNMGCLVCQHVVVVGVRNAASK